MVSEKDDIGHGILLALARNVSCVAARGTALKDRAGQPLGSVGAGSELAVDAFVIAVADLAGGAVVATVDASDHGMLAAHAVNVSVADISS